jgi:hypothetical protein
MFDEKKKLIITRTQIITQAQIAQLHQNFGTWSNRPRQYPPNIKKNK